jgi:photosystem II stability/assembly factor-like uncharacterized protein
MTSRTVLLWVVAVTGSFAQSPTGMFTGVSSSSIWGASWRDLNGGLPSAVAGASGLAIDPTTPSTLYSWTWNGALFKSTDGAGSWKTVNGVTGANWLVVDPRNSAILYAGTSYCIVKSANGGASWSRLSTEPGTRWLAPLVVDPQDSDTMYAVSDAPGRVIKSTDGGSSWKPSNTGLPGPPYTHFLTIDPVTPSTLYVVVGAVGIFRSTDGGESWFAINTSGENLSFGGNLAVDPLTPNTMYTGSLQASISKSTDGGRSWKIVRAGIPTDARIGFITIDPASPSNVYASYGGAAGVGVGILKSTNRGETWNVLNTGILGRDFINSPVVMDPRVPSTLYLGYVDWRGTGVGGISKTTDGGASWSPANAGRNFVDVRALAIHPVDTGVLYAAAGVDGVFKSVDGGENWTRLASFQLPATGSLPPPVFPAEPASTRSLVIDFARPNILYALTGRVAGCHSMDRLLFKSTDGGTTWSDASPSLSGCNFLDNLGVPAVIDPTDPDTLYVGAADVNENLAVLKTTDGGANWSNPLSSGCCTRALAVDPTNPATLYGGSWSGVLKSIDGGATWSNTGLSIGVNALAMDRLNPSILYAGSGSGLFKSTDGGATWFAINDGLDGVIDLGAQVTALVVDPARPQTFYAGTLGYGVFRSTDGGANWSPFNDGLTNLDIRLLALGPGRTSTLYAGTGSGVFAVSVTPERIRPARSRR